MKASITLLAALLLPLPILGQDAAEKKKDKPVLSQEELAAKQREVGQRLKRIEDTMKRIAKILAKQNPEQAARLRMAWNRSQSDANLEKVKEIEDLLRSEYFGPAFEKQRNLQEGLQRLLDILLDRDSELKDLQDEINRLQNMQRMLQKVIEQERGHFHETEKFADPEKTLQRAAAAKAKLKDLINRQNKLINDTANKSGDPGLDGLRGKLDEIRSKQAELRSKSDPAAQEKLAADAAQLAKDIARYAKGMPEEMKGGPMGRRNPASQAGSATDRAAQAMKDAAAKMSGKQSFSPSQKDAEQELREAAEALRRLEERRKQHDKKQLADTQERIRKDTGQLRKDMGRLDKAAPGNQSGSEGLGKAQGEMGKAKKGLDEGSRRKALPHEKEAKKELERAYKKLEEFEKELKRLMKLPDYDKLAKEQDDTTEDTEDLLKKMEEDGQSKGPDGEPTPGQQGVKGAKKAMQRASKNLRSKSAKRGNRDQKEAVDRLEKAQEELEDALRQLREEEQLMLLDALERRLNRMLQKQKKYLKETISLNLRLRDSRKPARADVDKARQIGEGESGLAVEADKVLEILREEGTTIVIPDVVAGVSEDLDNLARRLTALKAGSYTQSMQQDVIETLKELIQVIQEERNKKQGKPGSGGCSQEGESDDPLLPTSAELKMLKALQLRVNRRTSNFDRLREKEDTERTRLSKKQESVGTLTRTMADKLNQEDE